jgi:hypothetical protein
MDAHFHGHDGVLLLAEYSFAEITLTGFDISSGDKAGSR